MKKAAPCLFRDADGECGQAKNGPRHFGLDADHEYEPEPRPQWGSQRQPINPRSEKMERFYAEERRPAVAEAVGDGRRPCQIQSPVCTGYVQGIHESASRGRFGGLQAGLEHGQTFDCCHACNRYVGENPVWAKERGFLLSNRGDDRRQVQPERPSEKPRPVNRRR